MSRIPYIIAGVGVFIVSVAGGYFVKNASVPVPPQSGNERQFSNQADISGNPSPALASNLVKSLDETQTSSGFARLFRTSIDSRYHKALIVTRWAEIDPEGALQFLKLQDPMARNVGFYWKTLFSTWASSDPEMAFAACIGIDNSSILPTVTLAALEAAAATDPETAFRLFFATKRKIPAHNSVYFRKGWVQDNPEVSLSMIQRFGSGVPWSEHVRDSILGSWVSKNEDAALKWFSAHANELTARDARAVCTALAKTKPIAAARFFTSLSDDHRDVTTAGTIAAEIAKTDPSTALVWVDENLKGRKKQETLGEMLGSWAETDPQSAAPFMAELREGSLDQSMPRFMKAWVQKSPDEVKQWIASLEPGNVQTSATRQFGAAWFRKDPDAVAAYIRDSPPIDSVHTFLQGILNDGFDSAGSDLRDKKVEWVNSLPENLGETVAAEVGSYWAYSNAPFAADAVSRLDTPRLRELGAAAAVKGALEFQARPLGDWIAAQTDPAVRALFLDALSNPKLPEEKVMTVLSRINNQE